MKYSSKWKMWRAILDLRTCLICRKNHGKIYEIDEVGFRETERMLFSNDGLIFVTYDHYYTFIEIV